MTHPRIDFESMNRGFHKVHVHNAPPDFILHQFTEPDNGDPHDHPFDINVTILQGGYIEWRYDPVTGASEEIERNPGDSFVIPATAVHRIVRLLDGQCWTLATYGPKVQEPGFWQWDHGGAMRRQHDKQEWVRP